ncbi:MAG: hypothetical protein FD146_182 [Anaerolineaceae bacterium]|nr:MAG: hypothetical protein FD146_182 [Anaerolineaceae bacterium]
MNLPQDPSLPDQPIVPDDNLPSGVPVQLPPARRRRARRTLFLPGEDERARVIETLGRRAFPAFEFFLFSLLCGAILGAGYLLDSHSLLLLGILLAPLMTPWVGLTLAAVTGSWRFFFLTLSGLLFGGLLIFAGGALAGLAARVWMPLPMIQANIQAHLWWPNLFVLALGAVLLVASFVRSEEKPILASVMVVYELYLPLSAAGFGLGSGAADIWPNGLLVFLFHFALAVLLGAATLAVLRFRPRTFIGYLLPVTAGLASLVLILLLSGLGNILAGFFSPPPVILPTPTPSPVAAAFWTPTPSATTHPPTFTPSMTLAATFTPSQTPTPRPTPIYARVASGAGDGTLVRSEPGFGRGYVITSLINDYLVELLPEPPVVVDGLTWVHIRTVDGIEGWVLQSVLALATPVPTQTP